VCPVARASYEASLRIDPDLAFTHYMLGDLAWFVDGRLDEPVRRIQAAAEFDPGSPLYPAYLAAHWSDLGSDADAERWAETARRSLPHQVEMLVHAQK
jgi:hypothetical protein